MSFRVVFTDPHQHSLEESLLNTLEAVGARFEANHCPTLEKTISLCHDADAVITSAAQISRAVIERMSRCRIIARIGTGYDNVDVRAAGERGIPVTNVPNFCTEEVANHTIALLLALNRRIVELDRQVRAGVWSPDNILPTHRLSTQVLGLVGFGAIGRAVASRGFALGLRVLFFDPVPPRAEDSPFHRCDTLPELLRESDYVSLHLPLSVGTRHCLALREFRQMKNSAAIINTARGGLVEPQDLIRALDEGEIAAAALDVTEPEPPHHNSRLLNRNNVILSPHCASHSVESLNEVRRRAVEEVVRALKGIPLEHVVNKEYRATKP